MYRPSDQSVTLAQYLVTDVDAELQRVHESMRAETAITLAQHNAALNLMMGTEPYAADWTPLQTDAGGAVVTGDPGSVGPLVDDLTIMLKGVGPYTLPNAEQCHHRVLQIAKLDPAHPVAKHWRVMAVRCYATNASINPPTQEYSWDDVAAIVGA
jgi:hypothetical protein